MLVVGTGGAALLGGRLAVEGLGAGESLRVLPRLPGRRGGTGRRLPATNFAGARFPPMESLDDFVRRVELDVVRGTVVLVLARACASFRAW